MRATVLTMLALTLAVPAVAIGQVPGERPPARFLGFTGEMSTLGELYGISGREPRRPGSMGRTLFRPTVTLTRHVRLAFDFQLSTEGSGIGSGAASSTLGAGRQRLNQFGVSPTWDWGRVHLGDFTDQYTSLTFSGVRVRGGGVAVQPGIVRFAAFGGQARTAVIGGATTGSYKRNIAGGRVGLGREERWFFDLIFVRARDDEHSLPPAGDTAFFDPRLEDPTVDRDTLAVGTLLNPLAVTPQENFVLAAAGKVTLFERKLVLAGELSGSASSRDVRASALDNEAVLDEFPRLFRSLFTPRISSYVGLAYTAEAEVRLTSFTGLARYRQVDPGYAALGVGSMLTDQRAWELTGSQRFGRRVTVRLDAAGQRDNLLGQKSFTTNRDRYGLAVTVRPTTRWTTSWRANYLAMRNGLSAEDHRRIDYGNWILTTTQNLSLTRDRLFRSVGATYTFRTSGDENPLRQASDLTSHAATGRVVVAPTRTISLTPSVGLVSTRSMGEWRTRETYSLAAQVRAMEGRWTTSASIGSSQDRAIRVMQTRVTSRYTLTPSNIVTLSVRGSRYRNAPNPFGEPGDFEEFTMGLQFTHRFGGGGL